MGVAVGVCVGIALAVAVAIVVAVAVVVAVARGVDVAVGVGVNVAVEVGVNVAVAVAVAVGERCRRRSCGCRRRGRHPSILFASASSARAPHGRPADAADKVGTYQIVAVADVYGPRRDAVKQRSNGVATTHLDYHEVLRKTSTLCSSPAPDHWHVRMAVDALTAGKDVYLEKPVTHTIEEGATLTQAVRSSKQILQCGMQQRSWSHFRDAVDLIQGGSLGRVPQVRTYWWQNYLTSRPTQARRYAGARLEAMARAALPISRSARRNSISGAGSGIWRRRHDRSLHALDRRRALGDEA